VTYYYAINPMHHRSLKEAEEFFHPGEPPRRIDEQVCN
jgi:hypothetical protein